MMVWQRGGQLYLRSGPLPAPRVRLQLATRIPLTSRNLCLVKRLASGARGGHRCRGLNLELYPLLDHLVNAPQEHPSDSQTSNLGALPPPHSSVGDRVTAS